MITILAILAIAIIPVLLNYTGYGKEEREILEWDRNRRKKLKSK
jgi:type II secretory pathway pseudopilin PulG